MRHQGIKIILFIFLFVFVTTENPFSSVSAADITIMQTTYPKVLIIFGEGQDYPAVQLFRKGCMNTINKYLKGDIRYFTEYLDLSRYSNIPGYEDDQYNALKIKYSNNKPDVVIIHILTPMNKMVKYCKQMFPDVPVVIYSQIIEKEINVKMPSNFIVVNSSHDIGKEIQLIKKIQPEINKIYFIIGDSPEERDRLFYSKDRIDKYRDKIEIVFLNKLPLEKILNIIKKADKHSAVLYTTIFKDAAGSPHLPAVVVKQICKASSVPVYGISTAYLGSGLTGGYMFDMESIGAGTALKAKDMLLNKTVKSAGIPEEITNHYIFDWSELKRFGINEKLLPEGSRVVNKQPSLWELYFPYIIVALAVLILESVLIIYLLINRHARKKAEEKVIAVNKSLEKLNMQKDEFFANTSHEIKTPLNGIIAITENLLKTSRNRLTNSEKDDLAIVVSSGRRLSNLVNDMLDYSKLKYKDLELYPEPINLCVVVGSLFKVFNQMKFSKNVQLISEIDPGLPPVLADENRLVQILYNLIGNALKFTDKGHIKISANILDNMVEVCLEDTGTGIPEDKIEEIFKSFEQIDTSLTRKHGGTGLGLTITKYLVEAHKGRIWVKSKPGEGSKFYFTLPLSDGLPKSMLADIKEFEYDNGFMTIEGPVLQIIQEGSHVLIVDDDYTNLYSAFMILKSQRYTITTVKSGREALEKIRKNDNIALVILDAMMPEMSGFEVCAKIREIKSVYDLPVLMLTAKTAVHDIVLGLQSGANDYLVKPFEAEEFLARVKTLVELKKSVEVARQSELKFLKAQIKPHFIHNSLNTIIAISMTDPERSRQLLIEFSNYLRGCFEFNNLTDLIPVEKEIDFIQSYITIEQARFGKSIKVVYDFDNIDFLLPPLILEPLVENAVTHGLRPKQDGGTLVLYIKKHYAHITLGVRDDGTGIPPDKLASLFEPVRNERGIGLYNINQRLQKLYGTSLSIESSPGEGTDVYFEIPRQGVKADV